MLVLCKHSTVVHRRLCITFLIVLLLVIQMLMHLTHPHMLILPARQPYDIPFSLHFMHILSMFRIHYILRTGIVRKPFHNFSHHKVLSSIRLWDWIYLDRGDIALHIDGVVEIQ